MRADGGATEVLPLPRAATEPRSERSATARRSAATVHVWPAVRDFGLLEWAFAGVLLQTILFNPVLGRAGPLAVYLSALTWPALAAGALGRVASSSDPALRRACTAVLASTALVGGLIALQLGLLDLQVYSLSTIPKLAYIPAGIIAGLSVYRHADRLLDLIVVALGVKCTLLVAQMLQGPVDLLHRLNPRSLGGANTFAMFVGLLVVLRLTTWIVGGRRPGPFVLLSLPPCVAAMSLTFTRSALVAFGVGLVALLVLAIGRRGARAGLLSGGVALLLGGLLLLQAPVRERLASLGGGSTSGRDAIVDAAWQGINESPLVGHGFGSFQFSSPYIVEFSGAGSNTTPSAHNIFLQVGYEGGFIGLAVICWAIWMMLRPSWSSVLAPVILMLAVDGLFETFPYVIQTSWVLGVLLAVGLYHRTAAGRAAPRGAGP